MSKLKILETRTSWLIYGSVVKEDLVYSLSLKNDCLALRNFIKFKLWTSQWRKAHKVPIDGRKLLHQI